MLSLGKFFGFSGLGALAFGFDLLLLALLVEYARLPYLPAVACAFILATSFHYLAARRFVFRHSSRSYTRGYPYFIAFALINLALTVGLMYVFVTFFDVYYLLARPLVAALVGIWNFLINTRITFKGTFHDGNKRTRS